MLVLDLQRVQSEHQAKQEPDRASRLTYLEHRQERLVEVSLIAMRKVEKLTDMCQDRRKRSAIVLSGLEHTVRG